jgi:hypothetical protein
MWWHGWTSGRAVARNECFAHMRHINLPTANLNERARNDSHHVVEKSVASYFNGDAPRLR